MKLDFLGDLRRTHTCGELRASDAGKTRHPDGLGASPPRSGRRDLHSPARPRRRHAARLSTRRRSAEAHKRAQELGSEYVIAVEGTVAQRTAETVNPSIATGEVEVAGGEALDSE